MRVTGSSLPLLASCQWWARPNVEAPQRAATDAMMIGTEVHAAIENTINCVPVGEFSFDEAREYYATWLDWWEQESKSVFGDAEIVTEVAYSYSPNRDAGRCLGKIGGRNYPETPSDEIVGTVDAISIANGTVTIVDWKTGDDRGGLTADASENKQLRGYALAATRTHGLELARVMIVRIGTSGVKVTTHSLDAIDLSEAAFELQAQMAAIATAQPKPGSWCARCRAVAVCPASARATDDVMALAPSPDPIPLTITNENAAPLLEKLGAVRAVCDAVEAALKAFAEANGPFALPSGKTWGKVVIERSSIKLDGPESADALSVLEALGLSDAIESNPKTSRAAIERAVKNKGHKGKEAAGKVQAAMDELRRVGAIRTALVASFKEQ